MEDNYFDKKIKGIFDDPPEFPVDPNAAANMEAKLAGLTKRKKRGAIILWWPWLLVLPFLGFGIWGFMQMRTLQNQMSDLQSKLEKNENTDTLIKQVIYQYDTIYKVNYQEKWLPAPQPTLTRLSNFTPPIFNQQAPLISSISTSSFLPLNQFKKEKPSLNPPAWSNLNPIPALGISPFQIQPKLQIAQLPIETLAQNSKPQPRVVDFFRPNQLNTGLQTSPAIINQEISNATSWSAGLNIAIGFPRNQFLDIQADWLNIRFEDKEVAGFSQYPTLPPNNPDDNLYEVKGNFSYLQVYTGLRQQFLRDKKWQPNFSIGIVGIQPLRQGFGFEYQANGSEYLLEDAFNEGTFNLENIRIGIGLNWLPWEQWSIQSEVRYQRSLNETVTPYFPLHFWDLSLGLKYHLIKN